MGKLQGLVRMVIYENDDDDDKGDANGLAVHYY